MGSIEADYSLKSMYKLIEIVYKITTKFNCTKEIINSILDEECLDNFKNILLYVIKYSNQNPLFDENIMT